MNPIRSRRPVLSRIRSISLAPAADIASSATPLVPVPYPVLSSGSVGPRQPSSLIPLRRTLQRRQHGAVLPETVAQPAPRRRGRPLEVLPPQDRFPMGTVDMGRPEVLLPFGAPSVVNAATLKAMAGATRGHQLLKQVGTDWTFVPDDTLIDLRDRTQRFKVGTLTILS